MKTSFSKPWRPGWLLSAALSLFISRVRVDAEGLQRVDDRQPSVIRADVNLVSVPVLVTDRQGKTITGLGRSAFAVLEQGQLQQVASLSTEDAPCSIGIVLDASGSMKGIARHVRRSVRAFFDTLYPTDEVAVITVSDRPVLLFDFNAGISGLESKLLFARFGGSTALVDSVDYALQQMRRASHQRRALLVVSDGRDNSSRFSKRELMHDAIEAGTQIYTVGLAEAPRTKQEASENWLGISLLEDLAYSTGGLHSFVRDPRHLETTAAQFGRAMHDQYLITYYSPKRADEGKWRKLEVKVTGPRGQRVHVSARKRYFVPEAGKAQ